MNLLITFVAASVTQSTKLFISTYVSSVAVAFIEETFVVISPSFLDLYKLAAPLLLQITTIKLWKNMTAISNIPRYKISTYKI